MRRIGTKNDVFTGWEKMGITTGIPKVQINLIDIQRVGIPIDHYPAHAGKGEVPRASVST
jgi:hypothetical protein